MSTLRDMNVGVTDEASHADVLREAMVAELLKQGHIRTDQVA